MTFAARKSLKKDKNFARSRDTFFRRKLRITAFSVNFFLGRGGGNFYKWVRGENIIFLGDLEKFFFWGL